MLDDSHKRLRGPRIPIKIPLPRPTPKKNLSPGARLANARDRTSVYAFSQQQDLSESEREKFRKELKERFTPSARPMPTTLQGLTSLANERIEDAIARGQFKNIPRGKGKNTETDYNANSPFLDTTEYFMNKIIQRQEIVPPWIEKQQELAKAVGSFRGRLRNDWKRHASRVIASKGGTVEEQCRRAEAFAAAEGRWNPLAGRGSASEGGTDAAVATVTVEEKVVVREGEAAPEVVATVITVTESIAKEAPPTQSDAAESAAVPPTSSPTSTPSEDDTTTPLPPPPPPNAPRIGHPFRDPSWTSLESAYHTLAIAELNSLTRSYNLMAPKIAQKPYFTLERELNRMYADVAPEVAGEIRRRAGRPNVKVEVLGHREGGVMARFDMEGHKARVRDEDERKGYGFKEFWRDLFGGEKGTSRQ
jgi:hypothetical protein